MTGSSAQKTTTSSPCAILLFSRCRLDVLIEAEEVCWIILLLDGRQAFVLLGAIRGLDFIGLHLDLVVDIESARRKRFRRLPIILHPADIALVIGGILPHAAEHQSVAHVAVGDGSRVVGHATGTSSSDRVNDGVGKRRGNARVALNDGPDRSEEHTSEL